MIGNNKNINSKYWNKTKLGFVGHTDTVNYKEIWK